ncbi:MAG: hypothetical protein Q8K30_01425 [Candidatus Gracilibacteria bacterium]|nr:hypothetical protein [Candidatus Gracilibacteria bacterium]
MKKTLLIILFILIDFTFVSADSNFINDYTLIDCVNGNNSTGVAFDSSKPYSTLKEGIEKTIIYINTKINIPGNESNATGKIFNIKVNCSFYDFLNPNINLNYFGVNYNNELIIEGIGDNSLIIKDTSFNLGNNAGNITFKNAIFSNENKAYFNDYLFNDISRNYSIPNSNGIKIIYSYIKLNSSYNIGLLGTYRNVKYINKNGMIDYFYYQNYTNKQMIENSRIDIEVGNDFDFRMPVSLKNSKISFYNSGSTSNYNITFLEDGNTKINTDLNYSVLSSNLIDLGGNNLSIENSENIAFLNNKITNFSSLNLGGNGVFINNFIDNNQSIDISNNHNMFNNLFKSGFNDTYDLNNFRKNYSINNVLNTGILWVYKRVRDNKYFNVDISSSGLYKEFTGQDLVKGLGEIYVIFNY